MRREHGRHGQDPSRSRRIGWRQHAAPRAELTITKAAVDVVRGTSDTVDPQSTPGSGRRRDARTPSLRERTGGGGQIERRRRPSPVQAIRLAAGFRQRWTRRSRVESSAPAPGRPILTARGGADHESHPPEHGAPSGAQPFRPWQGRPGAADEHRARRSVRPPCSPPVRARPPSVSGHLRGGRRVRRRDEPPWKSPWRRRGGPARPAQASGRRTVAGGMHSARIRAPRRHAATSSAAPADTPTRTP